MLEFILTIKVKVASKFINVIIDLQDYLDPAAIRLGKAAYLPLLQFSFQIRSEFWTFSYSYEVFQILLWKLWQIQCLDYLGRKIIIFRVNPHLKPQSMNTIVDRSNRFGKICSCKLPKTMSTKQNSRAYLWVLPCENINF